MAAYLITVYIFFEVEAGESDPLILIELRRGRTRSGARYSGERKSHYASLRELKKAHPSTFSSVFKQYLLGKGDARECITQLASNLTQFFAQNVPSARVGADWRRVW